MTCIAAIEENGRVYMGADSAGSNGHTLYFRRDPKMFRVGEFLYGCTSSYRMTQLLRFKFRPPEHRPDVPLDVYLHTSWVDAVRKCFKAGGYLYKKDEVERGGFFLVGYRGILFQVESDFQIGLTHDRWDAVGCGALVARGALHAMRDIDWSPHERLRRALAAAEHCVEGVRRPFIFRSIGKKEASR